MATWSGLFNSVHTDGHTLMGQKTLRGKVKRALMGGRENRELRELVDAMAEGANAVLSYSEVPSPAAAGPRGGAVTGVSVSQLNGAVSAAQQTAIRADVTNEDNTPTRLVDPIKEAFE